MSWAMAEEGMESFYDFPQKVQIKTCQEAGKLQASVP
jgi:hypothetical protein